MRNFATINDHQVQTKEPENRPTTADPEGTRVPSRDQAGGPRSAGRLSTEQPRLSMEHRRVDAYEPTAKQHIGNTVPSIKEAPENTLKPRLQRLETASASNTRRPSNAGNGSVAGESHPSGSRKAIRKEKQRQALGFSDKAVRLWSFHFRVRTAVPFSSYLPIPRHGIEFVGFLLDFVEGQWDMVVEAANMHLKLLVSLYPLPRQSYLTVRLLTRRASICSGRSN